MPDPSDLTLIKRWLKSENDESFVAMPPPTSDRFTQDDAHYDAREEISERGLPSDTSYVVWHYQAHCFKRSGEMTGALYVYFGGDRSVVAAKLATAPERFVVSGGGSDADAFFLQRRLHLENVDVTNAESVAQVLERLTEGMAYRGDGRPVLAEPPTGETVVWLRAVLADPDASSANRVGALEILDGARAVSEADLSLALKNAESLFMDDEVWQFDVLTVIRLAWVMRRTDAEPLVRRVVATGGELAEHALLVWPDATAVKEARAFGFTVTTSRVRAAVEGREPREVVLEDVVAAHQRGDVASAESLGHALPTIHPAPGGRHDGYGRLDFPRILDDVRDARLPSWLRSLVADAHERTYFSMKSDADRGVLSRHYGDRDISPITSALAEWPDAVAVLRAELGDDAWRGPDVDDKWRCEDTLPVVRQLDESQERWFHEHVQKVAQREQALSLDGWGYLLEPLVANGLFAVGDAEAVL